MKMILISLILLTAYAQDPAQKEHVFRGAVERVDAKARTLMVKGQKVEGWMPAMTMLYKVDKDSDLTMVKVGDEITAKVYDGDFITLHDVQVVREGEKK